MFVALSFCQDYQLMFAGILAIRSSMEVFFSQSMDCTVEDRKRISNNSLYSSALMKQLVKANCFIIAKAMMIGVDRSVPVQMIRATIFKSFVWLKMRTILFFPPS